MSLDDKKLGVLDFQSKQYFRTNFWNKDGLSPSFLSDENKYLVRHNFNEAFE